MADGDLNRRTAGRRRVNALYERLRAKAGGPGAVPVIPVADGDPRMAAAAAEANRRFDEFVAALADRRPDDTFAVKVPIEDPNGREYMWVSVTAVDATHVRGQLDNDPSVVKAVRAGDEVRVPRSTLNDWLYVRGGKLHGGFTLSLLGEKRHRGGA